MENQLQTELAKRLLSILATVGYVAALTGVLAFSYLLLSFAMRIATVETSVLYSLPR